MGDIYGDTFLKHVNVINIVLKLRNIICKLLPGLSFVQQRSACDGSPSCILTISECNASLPGDNGIRSGY